jgi:hypothetical protein
VRWDELEGAGKNANRLYFDVDTTLRRLADVGDLFRPVLRLKQRLPQVSRAGRGRPRNLAKTPQRAPVVPRTSRQGAGAGWSSRSMLPAAARDSALARPRG